MWDAADRLDTTGDLWEESFRDIRDQVASIDWKGDAREAEFGRANNDMAKAKSAADAIRETATVSRTSAPELAAVQRSVLHAVDYAGEAGFEVAEDYTVTDTRTSETKEELAERQAQAENFAANIRQRVAQLTGMQQKVGAKLIATAAGIRKLTFAESPDFTPLATFTPPPDVSLIWCVQHVLSFVCTQYFPDGSTFVYPSPTDRSGVVTQHGP
jgi:hypothetical protein